jgi:hypothetical protein
MWSEMCGRSPLPDAVIEAIPTCVLPGESPKYRPISAAEHGRQRGLLHVPGEGVNVPREFWYESSGRGGQRRAEQAIAQATMATASAKPKL